MKVLIVLNCSYPHSGTGTNIIKKLLYEGGLIDIFDDIAFICGKENSKEKSFEILNGMQVFRVLSYSLYPKAMLKSLFKDNIFRFLHAILEKALFHIEDKVLNNSFEDRFAANAFFKKLKAIDASSYDLIISMSGRYYTSIAVAKYCRAYNVPFLFYQVDPCASNQYLPQKSLKRRMRIENDIYEAANYIVTTDLIHKDVVEYIPSELCMKIKELEFPLISERHIDSIDNKKEEKAVCVFTGSIYGGIRDPEYTLNLFRELAKKDLVELHFAGMEGAELKNAEFVICHGVLSIEDAMKLNAKADFLINIGNSVTNQVPSKIFDYISMGKPIVNICKNRNCPTIKYMEKYPVALNLYEEAADFDRQLELLKEFIIENKGNEVSFSKIKDIYYDCTPEYCANELMRLINNRS